MAVASKGHSSAKHPAQVTADALSRLRTVFPGNPRLDLYLGASGDFRGTGAPFDVQPGSEPPDGRRLEWLGYGKKPPLVTC